MPQSKQVFLGTGVLPQVGETKLVLTGEGTKPQTILRIPSRTHKPAATRGVYCISSRNASKRSQGFAPVATRCNLRAIGSRISLGSSVHFLAFSGRSMTAESK